MKQIITYLKLSFLLGMVFAILSCSSNSNSVVSSQLSTIENRFPDISFSDLSPKYLSPTQSAIVDSIQIILDDLRDQKMSKKDRAKFNYYFTLSSLLSNSHNKYISDSLIAFSESYYKKQDIPDYYLKSLFLHNIIHYKNENKDSLNVNRFSKALEFYKKSSLKDTMMLASINKWIGESYKRERDWDNSLAYFSNAKELYAEVHDSVGYLLSSAIYFRIFLLSSDSIKIQKLSRELQNLHTSNRQLQSYIYSTLLGYYSGIGDYKSIIEYSRKKELLQNPKMEGNLSDYYLKLSSNYYRDNQIDSALYYAKLSLKDININRYKEVYFSNIAKIYLTLGNYRLSSLYYQKAFDLLGDKSMKNASVRIDKLKSIELEKKYQLERSEAKIAAARNASIIRIIVLVAIVISAFSILFSNYKRLRDKKKFSDAQIKSMELTQQILRLTMSSLPDFTSEMNAIANRSAKHSSELFDDINSSINRFRANYKSNISSIVNSELFISQNPYLKSLPDLTDQEKLILFFYEQGYSSHDIAEVLGTTPENVRATKSRIRNKVSSGQKEGNKISVKSL